MRYSEGFKMRMVQRLSGPDPVYRDFRLGDVRHSLADVRKAEGLIGYQPSSFHIGPGL